MNKRSSGAWGSRGVWAQACLLGLKYSRGSRQHVPSHARRAGLLHAAQEAARDPRRQDGVAARGVPNTLLSVIVRALREFSGHCISNSLAVVLQVWFGVWFKITWRWRDGGRDVQSYFWCIPIHDIWSDTHLGSHRGGGSAMLEKYPRVHRAWPRSAPTNGDACV